jgi:hypothetical protein
MLTRRTFLSLAGAASALFPTIRLSAQRGGRGGGQTGPFARHSEMMP